MESSTIMYIVGGLLVLFAIGTFVRREKTVIGFNKNAIGIIAVLLGAFLILGQAGVFAGSGLTFSVAGGSDAGGSDNEKVGAGSGVALFQPTATYSSKDAFSSSIVSGTAYYKPNNNPATTTAYTNVNVGDDVTYWVSNDTYYVAPKQLSVGNGVNTFTALAYQNASVTVTGYDLTNRESTANGAYNTSMSANDVANEEITYQGTAKKSASPFGGVVVVEYNSTISSVTCTGEDLLSSNPFSVTYTPSATTHTYKVFAYGASMDDGTGSPSRISCQFLNGNAQAGAGAPYYVTFIPANYYVSNDGRILLDVEKAANNDNTRTAISNTIKLTANWGA